jgi:hypothetical protein
MGNQRPGVIVTVLAALVMPGALGASCGNAAAQVSTTAAASSIGKTAVVRPAIGSVPASAAATGMVVQVSPGKATFLMGWVEYNTLTCAEVSAGAWTVNSQPAQGTVSFGTVTGALGNGACPGDTFTFAGIYYTLNPASHATTDTFNATWNSPDLTEPETFNLVTASCAQILTGSVSGPIFSGQSASTSGEATQINATFVPKYGLTLQQAAQACGFATNFGASGFNWVQTTTIPAPSPFFAANLPNGPATNLVGMTFDPPPGGGYTYEIYSGKYPNGDSSYPFYCSASDYSSGLCPMGQNELPFGDSPGDACLPNADGTPSKAWTDNISLPGPDGKPSTVQALCSNSTVPLANRARPFVTKLVGILPSFVSNTNCLALGTCVDLMPYGGTFSWKSTFNGTAGGDIAGKGISPVDPLSGSGGGALVSVPLTVAETGSGAVTSSPAGIQCGATCGANFAANSPVSLSAQRASGWGFAGWTGACSGTGPCAVTMTAAQSVAAAFTPTDSHDFNNDGRSDIVWRDTNGNVAAWLMNGTAIAQSAGIGAAPLVWVIAGQRDFNGDGTADLLWHDSSGNVAMWFMNGASVIGSAGVGNANPSVWSIAGTGDFNGDGKGDILWHDSSGNVAIWLMNGSSIVQSCGVGNASAGVWSIAGTGDFNGDGKTDILWHDTAGNVAIWFMNGCSILQSSGVGNANPSVWSIAGTGDFNGDGMSDILWHDTGGNVAMWMMNGAAILQSAGVGNANPSVWSIAETGDVNADGMSDILWHDTGGDVAVWEMNGAAILRSAGIGNASASVWTIQGLNAD